MHSFKRQLLCRQVVAVGWELQNSSSVLCASVQFGLVSKVVTVWVTFFQQCHYPWNIAHLVENIKGFLMKVKSLRNITLQNIQISREGFHQNTKSKFIVLWNLLQILECMPHVLYTSCIFRVAGFLIFIYKITKIVRALWLAERRVSMRVCKDIIMVVWCKDFCVSRRIWILSGIHSRLSNLFYFWNWN